MSDKSSIEWTDSSWNPTRGCTKIAQGCKNCYAETFAERFRDVAGHPYERGFDPRTAPDKLTEPLKWKKARRIFVDSMSDLFHEAFPFHYIAAVFGVMAACPQHTFQVLTKRPERAAEFFAWIKDQGEELRSNVGEEPPSGHAEPSACALFLSEHAEADLLDSVQHATWPLPNVWIGTSVAEQKDADKNIPHLLQIPAAVRFLSVEPLIAPVDLFWYVQGLNDNWTEPPALPLKCMWAEGCDKPVKRLRIDVAASEGWKSVCDEHTGIHWVIVGCESGRGARPMDEDWVRTIRDQCQSAGVAFFYKQKLVNGKKVGLPELDGRVHAEFPEPR